MPRGFLRDRREEPDWISPNWADLLRRCCATFHPAGQQDAAYRALCLELGDDPWAGYDGDDRSDWLALKAANLLGARLARLFAEDAAQAWAAYELYFGRELSRLVHRRCATARLAPGVGTEDVRQDVALRLAAREFAALRRYDGRGSYHGYLGRIARNAIEDAVRAVEGRPNAVRRSVRNAGIDPRPRHVPLEEDGGALAVVDPSANPEDRAIDVEEAPRYERALEALEIALGELPDAARRYLFLRFQADPPLPPRRIAAELGMTVAQTYRARQIWERQLRTALRKLGVEKFPTRSV